jgi:hypothetical protein
MTLAFSVCAIFGHSVLAQKAATQPTALFLVEDFTYPAGSALTANGWTAHSAAGTNAIVTSAPSLTLSGYPGSGVGNAVSLTTSGEDVNRAFAVQSTGAVYAAFMVNISEASTDAAGGYFFHLGPDPVSTTFRGRVFIKKDASNNVAFGISKALTGAADIVYTPFSYSLNTTYLLIVKYTIVSGATNDTVSLFVSTDVPATEPAPTITASDTTQSDVNPGTVSLRQGSAATAPTVRVDGIRVGDSWASVTTPALVPSASMDFNGDGKTDYSLIRESGGFKNWWILQSTTGGIIGAQWGLSGDSATPADYDGDGKTDIAVWRSGLPDQAAFYIFQSSSSTVRVEVFGQVGDQPTTVADYDGDGIDDVAVYRPGLTPGSQSFFFYRGSLNNPGGNITYVPWGVSGDVETNGDFDGDGKADFCVRRDIGGSAYFILLKSTGGVEWINWGLPTDAIMPGDYDGDGRSDFCVARIAGSFGNFYILERDGGGTGASPIVFGDPNTDNLAHGDYDGDSKTDIAVFRENADAAQNYFYVLQSSNGSLLVQEWGQQGDDALAEWNVTGGN